MTKRMLIDATHAEETRVVVLDGNRLEDYDVETSTKKQLKGNIYLAKVVRVEPSLQAAFVEYGGGRHGFLAFSEIHPDYYQIPVADRQRLLDMAEAEARADQEQEDAEDARAEAGLPASAARRHDAEPASPDGRAARPPRDAEPAFVPRAAAIDDPGTDGPPVERVFEPPTEAVTCRCRTRQHAARSGRTRRRPRPEAQEPAEEPRRHRS